jgi:hypothetical protein
MRTSGLRVRLDRLEQALTPGRLLVCSTAAEAGIGEELLFHQQVENGRRQYVLGKLVRATFERSISRMRQPHFCGRERWREDPDPQSRGRTWPRSRVPEPQSP